MGSWTDGYFYSGSELLGIAYVENIYFFLPSFQVQRCVARKVDCQDYGNMPVVFRCSVGN